ncbi:hypothetical protein ACFU9Y_01130 [Streptomyces sp. NPDC057621]|uniref:hypothetical protein n=1 Tax=Streptomyces sp. NPDC057621 TaxID=3346186 RepID=UPI00367F0B27
MSASPQHYLAGHALDYGIRVWMRGLGRRVDESPRLRRFRGVAAPLYGESIRDLELLRDFVTDFVDNSTNALFVRLSPGRIRDAPLLCRRCDIGAPSNYPFFARHLVSPLQTYGPWDEAAAEAAFSQVRGLEQQRSLEQFATGLPELSAGIEPAAVFALTVIGREQAESLAAFPARSVRTSRRSILAAHATRGCAVRPPSRRAWCGSYVARDPDPSPGTGRRGPPRH